MIINGGSTMFRRLKCLFLGHLRTSWPNRAMCSIIGDDGNHIGYVTEVFCMMCGKREHIVTWVSIESFKADNVVPFKK